MTGAAVRLLLASALVAMLAAPLAAQPPASPTTTVTASTEPPRPAISYGPDTPRGAMARLLAALHERQYARAAEYLNLRNVPRATRATRGAELARELDAIFERALPVDPEHLSDQPNGDPDDGLPALTDSLGTIDTASGSVEVLIERVPQPGKPPVWQISAGTVAAIPALYEEFGWGPLARVLPSPFFEVRFLGIRLWQWLALIVLLAAVWLVSGLARALVVAVVRWILGRRGEVDARMVDEVIAPLRLGVAAALFAAALPFLALALAVQRMFVGALKALAIVIVTWILLRVLDVLGGRLERRLEGPRYARAIATVPLGRRTVKVFVALVAFIAALQNFGFNVTGLIAGLGVGGLAVALAAQKTVENLFGSFSLVADEPVRVGDVCRFGDTVGRVEDIGLRSTRVRTVDHTLVTVPNANFSTLALENLSRRDRIPVRATLTLPPGTSAQRVRQVLTSLREMAVATAKVHGPSVRTRFVRMGPQALEIELTADVVTAQWDEFVDIREQVFLHALEIVSGEASELG
jgi:MscS family membrane protein